MTRRLLALAIAFCSLVGVAYYTKINQSTSDPARLDTSARDAHLTAGLKQHQQGQLDEALREYAAAAAIDPESALAFYDIGVAQYQKKNIDAAVQAYMRAIALTPAFADAQFNLGYIHLHDRNDAEAALGPLRAATQANGRMAKAFYELGLAYQMLGLSERAKTAWDTAVTIDPGYRDAVARAATPAPAIQRPPAR